MKKHINHGILIMAIALFLGIFSGAKAYAADVALDEDNFPDSRFRLYLEYKVDKNRNGILEQSETEAVTYFYIPSVLSWPEDSDIGEDWSGEDLEALGEIKDLTGISCFTNLATLIIEDTDIKKLDLRQNKKLAKLICYETPIETLRLYKYTPLTLLNLRSSSDMDIYGASLNDLTKLQYLDISHCNVSFPYADKLTELKYLNCSYNNSDIQSLDLSACTKLQTVYCEGSSITSLNVSNLKNLNLLNCSDNRISSLNLSDNTALRYLYCSGNSLSKLNVTNNTKLFTLACSRNRLTTLDLRKNKYLQNIVFYGNLIKKLDISNTLYGLLWFDYLYCFNFNEAFKNDVACTIYMTKEQKSNFLGLEAYSVEDEEWDSEEEIVSDYLYPDIKETRYTNTDSRTSKMKTDPVAGLKEFGITLAVVKYSSAKLSSTSYTYDGSAKKPKVTVKNNAGTTLVKDKDYTVSYASGRTKVGKYAVTIKGMGKYSFKKTLYFKIKPKKTRIRSIYGGSHSFTVKWSRRLTQVTGYEVKYSAYSSFSKSTTRKITSNKTTSKTIKNLRSKKKYYVKVRTYKMVNGVKYVSGWCLKKSVTTK